MNDDFDVETDVEEKLYHGGKGRKNEWLTVAVHSRVTKECAEAMALARGDLSTSALIRKWVEERADVEITLRRASREDDNTGHTISERAYKVLWVMSERRNTTVHRMVITAIEEWAALNRHKGRPPGA